MRTSKKSGKTTLYSSILPLLLIVLAVGFAGVPNTLVTFAVGRNTVPSNISQESNLSETDFQGIADNWKVLSEQTETWTSSAAVEEVHVTSEDGLDLFGVAFITDETSHLWVIAVHGYRGDHTQMMPLATAYGTHGYNALLPDLRACGQSEGQYIGMGWLDRLDMLKWISRIIERDNEAKIILHGISMGGATVMMTAGESLPPQVCAVVEDCGYTSVWDIFEDVFTSVSDIPVFPLFHIASLYSAVRVGYSFTEASSLNQVKKAQVPILFIHGAEDTFVKTQMVYPLYEACASEKQLLVVDHAAHGISFIQAPELYFDTVFRFIEPYIQ